MKYILSLFTLCLCVLALGQNSSSNIQHTLISDTPPKGYMGIGAGVLVFRDVPVIDEIGIYGVDIVAGYNDYKKLGIHLKTVVGPFQDLVPEVRTPATSAMVQFHGAYHFSRSVIRQPISITLKTETQSNAVRTTETNYYTKLETNSISLISVRGGGIYDNLSISGFVGGQYTMTKYAKADFGSAYGTKKGWTEVSGYLDLIFVASHNELQENIEMADGRPADPELGYRIGAQLRISDLLQFQVGIGKRQYNFLEAGGRINFGL
ncbi:MAG: hypothetical protein MK081_00185 [Flavobacteriales bacterium]|nr:hypothetical protein [Flavobacteriales bacterium]